MPQLPPVTKAFMLACVGFFCLFILVPEWKPWLALWPISSGYFMPWQMVSYAFLHGDAMHLFFNMLGLWMFGSELERLWGGDETLIVVSSDLSHYLPYAAAREIDATTARRILAGDPDISHDEACGATPLNGLLLAARRHGLHAEKVDLRNSGDTAGDRSRVVGYGGFAFYPGTTGGSGHVQ